MRKRLDWPLFSFLTPEEFLPWKSGYFKMSDRTWQFSCFLLKKPPKPTKQKKQSYIIKIISNFIRNFMKSYKMYLFFTMSKIPLIFFCSTEIIIFSIKKTLLKYSFLFPFHCQWYNFCFFLF